jgi:hypothetical protein
MGLLTDLSVRDQKTKRRINMIKTMIIILALFISTFIPQIMNLAYQQGKQFANETCLFTVSDLENYNGSLPYKNSGVGNGLEKTP